MLKIVSASFCLKVPNISFSQSELKEALQQVLEEASSQQERWEQIIALYFHYKLVYKHQTEALSHRPRQSCKNLLIVNNNVF